MIVTASNLPILIRRIVINSHRDRIHYYRNNEQNSNFNINLIPPIVSKIKIMIIFKIFDNFNSQFRLQDKEL